MRGSASATWLELLLVVGSLGCSQPERAGAKLLLPTRRASPFVCEGARCRQEHPRLPDTGEWRCAERGQVVWCAGGEPAAGVVKGADDPAFHCAPRWGAHPAERVCIARRADYPHGRQDDYRCSYEQEVGMARACTRATPSRDEALSSLALPACWLDADCGSRSCDRGACRCARDGDCHEGNCRDGVCAGDQP